MGSILATPTPAPAETSPTARVEVDVLGAWSDPDIDESSGLIWWRDHLVTTNDSGTGAKLYVAQPDGTVVGTMTYAESDPHDVEALALGPDGAIWVGDIGDNLGAREQIALYRIDAPRVDGRVEATRYDLRYPDGARNAETMVVHPVSGEILIVTKDAEGSVYRVSPTASPTPATLEKVDGVALGGILTDGTFDGSGSTLYVRGYLSVAAYRYPGFTPLWRAGAPLQRQGEGLAISPQGDLLASTEGAGSDIQRWSVTLTGPEATSPTSSVSSSSQVSSTTRMSSTSQDRAPAPPPEDPGRWWSVIGAAAAALVTLGLLTFARRRRPG